MRTTIYHNPRCGKSRETLRLLEDRGEKPVVIEYLNTPPSAADLKRILRMLDKSPRELIRRKEASDAGIDPAKLSDEQLITAMVRNPIIIERPVVVKGGKAALGRPPESVLDIL